MKRTLLLSAIFLMAISTVFSQKTKKKEKEELQLKTKADTISYILGSDIGKNIRTSKIDFSEAFFNYGVVMGYKDTDTLFKKEEVEKIMKAFQSEMEAKMNAEKEGKLGETKAKGETYLAENKKKEGVKVLPDGLQFRVIKEGEGNSPKETDTVSVFYKGMLTDGTVFDSALEGEPVSFPLNNLIKGWTEGIQLMKVGSKYEFVVPSNLGYGDREVGPIPAGSTLVFEVELKAIKPSKN